ncbi:prolyl 4-hydroxylase [Streptomyces glebosus]|uniref:Prolyl 4-hydroxylase n=1 Tax=Streptomyces glebosus TaxID=249580 RepID=A0A640SN72_9ACTN|nr:2OG-Fe(II) oxygenase [Streptomyces glebosus]GFE12344.1 prolyl 4-hydroxylase [Streptomyces glebosus]GHG71795.1 prolyl 4-hydroxylase [Streptomyces glebosus]
MTTTTTTATKRHARPGTLARRVAAADWTALAGELNTLGCAVTPRLLAPADCRALSTLYDESAPVDGTDPGGPARFRSTIDMARHRFGSGQYRYFADPLPGPVQALREAFYPHLLEIARDWADKLGRPAPWPDTLEEWLTMCHEAGQSKSSQILLRYGAGDWNALHRDIFGEMVFPLQVVIGLDEQGSDYTGGEFLLVEQRPRAQSRGTSTVLPQGHGLIFTTRDRPVRAARGWSAGPVRHGVSTIRSGRRHSLGLVFHDA